MAHAHFIEVQQENGQTALVRADEITAVEPKEKGGVAGYMLHTAGCSLFAPGETVETIKNAMQSAQITVVTLQSRGLKPAAPVVSPAQANEPARQVVVRAPPPVAVEGVTDVEEAAPIETPVAEPVKPAKKKGAA